MDIKRGIWSLALGLMLLNAVAAQAKTIYVKAGATGSNNGGSWINAYTSLQSALAAAKSGDEIWVATGTYKPTSDTNRNKSFVLVSGVAVYGGFAGGEATKTNRDWNKNKALLSGEIGEAGKLSDNSYHVVTGASLATLDGFTVSGGFAVTNGGGMINTNTTSLTVANCTFSGNTANDLNTTCAGGGMFNDGGSPTVINCSFVGNTAGGGGFGSLGGGMSNKGGAPTVTNCTFSDNYAMGTYYHYWGSGGGMCNDGGWPTVTGCTFSNNMTGNASSGGGMYNINPALLKVANCTFNGNSCGDSPASDSGGGGMSSNGGTITVTDCTFVGNKVGFFFGGGGMFNNNLTLLLVTRCVFAGNSSSELGGGMFSANSLVTLTNCAFSGNAANGTSTDSGGGAIYNMGATLTAINCTFNGNSSTHAGGGLSNNNGTTLTMTNCILWNNTAPAGAEIDNAFGNSTYRHCDIRGSGGSGTSWNKSLGTDGGGNIAADPLFFSETKPAGLDGIWLTADDGLRLKTKSPCINAGDYKGAPSTDILKNKHYGLPEIGAYEYVPNGVRVWAIYE